MFRTCSPRIGAVKVAAILVAGSLTLTSGSAAAPGQSVEGSALAYISIPLDGSTDGAAYGLRLNLTDGDGADLGDPDPRSSGLPPVLEVRFGLGEEPGELQSGGIASAMVPDSADLDDDAALWIGAGLGLAAVVAIVVAADAVCIGINAPCSKDKDDRQNEDTDEPTPK